MSKNETFSDKDILVVSVETFVDNYHLSNPLKPTVPVSLSSKKVNEVKVTGEQYKQLLEDVEEDLESWQSAEKWEKRKQEEAIKSRAASENVEVENLSQESIRQAKIENYLDLNTASNKFFQDVGRPRKSLKSVKLIKNEGPLLDPVEAQAKSAQEKQDALIAALTRLAESMTKK